MLNVIIDQVIVHIHVVTDDQKFYTRKLEQFSNKLKKHGIYIRWYLINRCARKEQSLLFDRFKANDKI